MEHKDESLIDPDDSFAIILEEAVETFLENYGIPDSPVAEHWLDHPNYEDVLTEYFHQAGGFSVQEWESMIQDIRNIVIEPDLRGGIFVTFEFDFESADGGYEGTRGASGSIR